MSHSSLWARLARALTFSVTQPLPAPVSEPDPDVLAQLAPALRELYSLTLSVRRSLVEDSARFEHSMLLSTILQGRALGQRLTAADRREGASRLVERTRDDLRDVAERLEALDPADATMLAEHGFSEEQVRWLARDTGAESRKFLDPIRGTRIRLRRAQSDLEDLARALARCARPHPYR